MTFRYLSVCSGLEAATLAFEPLGATPIGFAEIEKFPAAIIAHRYGSNMPGEPLSQNAPPNFGDFTKIDVSKLGRVEVLIGGTPCQAFSLAGNRLSLEDARGNLTISYAVLAHELVRSNGLRNSIWENVPGVLRTKDNAFGCFLGAIVGADDALHTPDGGEWPSAGMVAGPRARAAWRVLDAQYFGVPQRRRRVFLVADFGTGADPAAVLFEPASVRGNTPPRREKGQGVAPTIAARTRGGGGLGTDFDCDGGLIASTGEISHCLNAGGMGRQDYETETLIAHALRGRDGGAQFEGPHDTANIRAASGGGSRSYVATQWAVRRLTPVECERLQGVPDNYTRIPWRGKPADQCPDGNRYKAIGNSWAVSVVTWIGRRLIENMPK